MNSFEGRSLRVIINVSEQIPPSMLERLFQSSHVQAMVAAAPKEMMLEIMRSCKMDVCAFYAEEVDAAELAAFFREVSGIGSILRVLFLDRDKFCLINRELENCIDECFTVPLDSHDLMMRLRRLARTAAAENTAADIPSPAVNIREVPVSRQVPGQMDSVPEFLMKIRQMAKSSGTRNTVFDIPAATRNAPVDDIPADDIPVDDIPADDAPVDDIPVDDIPADDAPVDNVPVDNVPADDTPAGVIPVDDNPVDVIPADDNPADVILQSRQEPGHTDPSLHATESNSTPVTGSPPAAPVQDQQSVPAAVPAVPLPVRSDDGQRQELIPPEYRPAAAAPPQTDSFMPRQVFVPSQPPSSAAPADTRFSAAGFQPPLPLESPVQPRPSAPENGGSLKGKKAKTRSTFKHLKKDELLEIISAQQQRLDDANRKVEEISRQINNRRWNESSAKPAGPAGGN